MTIRNEWLRVVVGDVTSDSEALGDAVRRQDVVISALGTGKSFKSGGLIARSVPRILEAMRRHGVRRLIFTSAFGVGSTWRDVPIVPRIFARVLLRDVYADKQPGRRSCRAASSTGPWYIPLASETGPEPAGTGSVNV